MSSLLSISSPSNAHFDRKLAMQVQLVLEVLAGGEMTAFNPVLVTYEAVQVRGDVFREEMNVNVLHNFKIERRHAILRGIGQDMGETGHLVHMIFFVAEAWLSIQEGPQRRYKQASADPARIEVVSVSGMTLDKKFNMAYVPIHRDHRECITAGEPVVHGCAEPDLEMGSELCQAFYDGLGVGLSQVYMRRKAAMN